MEGDESAAGAALRLAGACDGVTASAGAGAGTGVVEFGLSGSTVSCARNTAVPAQSVRAKTHVRPAKDIRLREWEVQLMDITIEDENGVFLCFSLLPLDTLWGFRVDLNSPVL
jgi:hypothetical protein